MRAEAIEGIDLLLGLFKALGGEGEQVVVQVTEHRRSVQRLRRHRHHLSGEAALGQHIHKPAHALTHRQEQVAVRRRNAITQKGHRQAFTDARRSGQQPHHLIRQGIEAVHIQVLAPQVIAAAKTARHIGQLILAVAETLAEHVFVLGIDLAQIQQLFPGDARRQLARVFPQQFRSHAAPLQVGDQRGGLFHKTLAGGQRAIIAQLILQLFQRQTHRHAPPGRRKRFPAVPAAAFQNALIQARGAQHINQEQAVQMEPVHQIPLRLQGELLGHQQDAVQTLLALFIQFQRHRPKQTMRPGGENAYIGHWDSSFPLEKE